MASARPPQPTPDTAAWRLALQLVTTVFDGEREKFVRLIILLIIITAAIGGLVLLLGPYTIAGLGISTLASRTCARRTRR